MNSYILRFSEQTKEEIKNHKKSGNKAVVNKIIFLLNELTLHPFSGIGKPEQLKHHLAGLWSRRINKEHRLIYEVENDIVMAHSVYEYYL